MACGDESSALFRLISSLTSEIEEQKRQIAKEEEIGKKNDRAYHSKLLHVARRLATFVLGQGLNQMFEAKSKEFDELRAKRIEMEEATEQNRRVYASQKQVLERLDHTAALLREKLIYKKEELEKKKKDAELTRQRRQETLNSTRRKFQEYMKLYETLPGVREYLEAKKQNEELESRLDAAKERLVQLQKKKDMQVSKKNPSSKPFDSLRSWGVAVAHKYIAYVAHQKSMDKKLSDIAEKKKNIEDLKQKLKDKERAKVDLERKKEFQNRVSSQSNPPATKTSRSSDSHTFKKNSGLSDYRFTSKSPFRLSSPNLATESHKKTLQIHMPSFTFPKSTDSLMRSKSLSSLAKGASGSQVKQTVPKSLQSWLSTGNAQKSNVVSKSFVIPKPNIPTTSSPWKGRTENCGGNNERASKIHLSETPSPCPKLASPAKPTELFRFNDVYMSPDDGYQYSPYVMPGTPTGAEVGSFPSSSHAADFHMSASREFQFAVPSAPAPGKSARKTQGEAEEKRSATPSSYKELFPSLFSAAAESDNCDAGPSGFQYSGEDSSAGGFSFFGRDMEDSASVDQPGQDGFVLSIEDHEKTQYESLFSFGGANN